MERLTEWGTRGVAFIKNLRPCGIPNDCNDIIYEVTKKCAAYEDTGLEPEEVKRVQETLFTAQRLKKEQYGELEKYLKAEAEGRLLILPYKFGTPVFVIRHEVDVDTIPDDFKAFMFGTPVVSQEMFGPWLLLYPGEIYLDREDAEAALKGETNG